MKKFYPLVFVSVFLIQPVFTALAVPPPEKAPSQLDALMAMRQKQEQEEKPLRIIQPVPLQMENVCSPIQQARQRLRDLPDNDQNKKVGSVDVTAGHGDVAIDSNDGVVNNSVNVQIVNPNEKNCL
ncbi:MAG: hypothetical protein HYS22_00140 [Deltaproteobacteria bacterium]|nr:hypothetical protein [Deltaproteobacteria bacterium]